MRVVLDTSVIVSALRSRHGASNRLLQMAFAGAFQVLATPALFLEYEEVLGRTEQREVDGLPPGRMSAFLIGLAGIIEPVKVYYRWRPQMQGVDDEMVLDAAINGRADTIVTHNLRDFAAAASRFNLRVASPAALVGEVLKMSKSAYPVKLPPSLGNAAQKLAEEDGVSLSQWVAIAVAQKISSVETAEGFFQRKSHGAEQVSFLEILRNAPDRPPDPGDELEPSL
jgi:putative PIN family toxin of toxin-antitoxin system